jgi:hypothetical protein
MEFISKKRMVAWERNFILGLPVFAWFSIGL